MDTFFLAIKGRVFLLLVFLAGSLAWYSMCSAYHESYWDGTMRRPQIVDFNLLHHSLPITLSQLIIANRDDLIQKVLDSSFGLFGLAVTDPTGKSILYVTNQSYRGSESWQKHITPDDLAHSQEPYDLLMDPPPIGPGYIHSSPQNSEATGTGVSFKGKVLGRIYYLRNLPPTLLQDFLSFFQGGFWDLSGPKRGYLFITLATVGFSFVVFLFVLLRQRSVELRQQHIEHVDRELQIRKKALEHLSVELTTQRARKSWLEKEADQSYKYAMSLKRSLERLRDAFTPAYVQTKSFRSIESSIMVRPPVHAPSTILEEIESMIPQLTNSARTLKSQAGVLNEYCSTLEGRLFELERLTEEIYDERDPANEVLDMTPVD
jgi:hypothetical protein